MIGFLPPPVATLRRPSVFRVDGPNGDCRILAEKSEDTKSTAGWLKSNSGVCMDNAGCEIVVAGCENVVTG